MSGFLKGVKQEWTKIIWPSKSTLRNKTAQVIVISAILGTIISILDYIFQTGINWVINLL